ncbi:group I truncated hemoglobin [Nitrospira japonica]|nr:group 1 truncated hemoglobin [Nitrospira japonica]
MPAPRGFDSGRSCRPNQQDGAESDRKQHLVDQVCSGAGGLCIYKGRDMKTTHAGMKISEAEFGALIGDLVKALTSFNAPSREQQELLAVLGPMKKDIVEYP